MPASGAGPGILLFQEIFGINDNMRGLADRLADAGYVALVPDMFWRLEPRFERKDESGMGDAFGMIQRFDFDTAPADINATHAHLLSMRGVHRSRSARSGSASAAPSRSRPPRPVGSTAGASTPRSATTARPSTACSPWSVAIECPVMYHYGDADSFIPPEDVDEVERTVASCPGVEFHRYPAPAGHAFSNWDAPSMYHAPAADAAWGRTLEFLDRHLR